MQIIIQVLYIDHCFSYLVNIQGYFRSIFFPNCFLSTVHCRSSSLLVLVLTK